MGGTETLYEDRRSEEGEKGIWAKVVILKRIMNAYGETRPDTRQSSRGRLGRSSNVKPLTILEIFWKDEPTDRPIRQGVQSRVRDWKSFHQMENIETVSFVNPPHNNNDSILAREDKAGSGINFIYWCDICNANVIVIATKSITVASSVACVNLFKISPVSFWPVACLYSLMAVMNNRAGIVKNHYNAVPKSASRELFYTSGKHGNMMTRKLWHSSL